MYSLVGHEESTVNGEFAICPQCGRLLSDIITDVHLIFIMWQPCRAADTSTNWRQSLFCCFTASMEQATDAAETAVIDGLVSP